MNKEEKSEEKTSDIPSKEERRTFEIIRNPDKTLEINRNFKVIVIGNIGVGKSCLSLKGTKGIFEDDYVPTVGVDFFTFVTKVKPDGSVIRLHIWDTCGQEGYKSLIQNFFREASLAILVYSIDDVSSFNAIEGWIKQLKNYSSPDVKIFLIGNKSDLEDKREVPFAKGQQKQKEFRFNLFLETSAKTGFNSENLFLNAAELLYDEYLEYKETNPRKLSARVTKKLSTKKKAKLKIDDDNNQKSCC